MPSEPQEVFEDLPPIGMGIVKEFRVKLHTKKRPIVVLHCLNRAGLIGGCSYEMLRQTLHFIEV